MQMLRASVGTFEYYSALTLQRASAFQWHRRAPFPWWGMSWIMVLWRR